MGSWAASSHEVGQTPNQPGFRTRRKNQARERHAADVAHGHLVVPHDPQVRLQSPIMDTRLKVKES